LFATLRSVVFAVVYNISGMLYGSVAVLLLPLPLKLRHRIIISWTEVSVFLVRWICGIRYQVSGLEHIPKRGDSAVIMSKHQSAWETLYLQGAFWPASTVLKRELLKIPFFGWGLASLRPIPIDRGNPRVALRQVKEEGMKRLQDGYNVLLFPEGTRVAVGQRGKYARSGADIAIAAGKKIIPVALNSGHFWPPKQFTKRPGCIKVVIGEPICCEGKTSKELIDSVETWIENTLEHL